MYFVIWYILNVFSIKLLSIFISDLDMMLKCTDMKAIKGPELLKTWHFTNVIHLTYNTIWFSLLFSIDWYSTVWSKQVIEYKLNKIA